VENKTDSTECPQPVSTCRSGWKQSEALASEEGSLLGDGLLGSGAQGLSSASGLNIVFGLTSPAFKDTVRTAQ
jgi:hypothetical protein